MKSLWKSFCSLKLSTVFAVTTALTFFFLSGDQAFAEGLTLPFVTILTDYKIRLLMMWLLYWLYLVLLFLVLVCLPASLVMVLDVF